MKPAFIVISLVALLLSQPAAAQLGPAGVPGLFDLVESITTPAPPAPAQTQQEKAGAVDCSKAKDIARCKRQEERRKNAGNCSGKSGTKLNQCLQKLAQTDCSKTPEPVVCERHQKAHALCKDKIGQEHRQCLRDNLAPKK